MDRADVLSKLVMFGKGGITGNFCTLNHNECLESGRIFVATLKGFSP